MVGCFFCLFAFFSWFVVVFLCFFKRVSRFFLRFSIVCRVQNAFLVVPVRFLKRQHFFTADGIVIMPHERYIKGLVAMYDLQNRRRKPTPDGAVSMMDMGEELIGESRKKFRSALGTLL